MVKLLKALFGTRTGLLSLGAIILLVLGIRHFKHTTAIATVNGEAITEAEYSHELQKRTDLLRSKTTGKIDPAILKQLHLGSQVLDELIRRKLIAQAARKMGLTVSGEQVRQTIERMTYFQTAGKFSADTYKAFLARSQLTPAEFEERVQAELLSAKAIAQVRNQVNVSEDDIKEEFLTQSDQRQFDYVAIGPDAGKKLLSFSPKEIDGLLREPSGLAAAKAYYAKMRFEYVKPVAPAKAHGKNEHPKPPEFYSFDEVKTKVALEVLRDRHANEALRLSESLAQEVLKKARALRPGELRAFLKSKKLELKTSEKLMRTQRSFAGISELPQLLEDAFRKDSPLVQSPQLYNGNRIRVVAMGLKIFSPNLADLKKRHDQFQQMAMAHKARQAAQLWLSDLRKEAKIWTNDKLATN